MTTGSQHNLMSSAVWRFETLIIALMFFLPFGQQLITNLLLLFILLNALLSLKLKDWIKALTSPVFYLPGIFMLFLALSLFWSADTADGALQLETKMTILFAPLVLAASARVITRDTRKKWLRSFVWGSLAVMLCAFGIAGSKAIDAGSWYPVSDDGVVMQSFFVYERLAEPFMHPGYLSAYIGIAILIVVSFVLEGRKRFQWIPVLVFLLFSIFMLQGRINVLALLAVVAGGALIYAIRMRAYKWLLVPLLPVIMLVIILLFASEKVKQRYFQVPDFSYDISADASSFNSATYRLAEWTCAADAIADKPLIGAGLGGNRIALQKAYEERSFNVGFERKYNAHNQYLEVTLAGGFIGLLLFLTWLSGYLGLGIRRRDYLFLATWIFFMLSMLTESMLERAWAVVLCSTFFPLLLLNSRINNAN